MKHYKSKFIKKVIFKLLIRSIDLSELLYKRLKYIKQNKKEMLIRLFDERDKEIDDTSELKKSNSKLISLLLEWLWFIFSYHIPKEIIKNLKEKAQFNKKWYLLFLPKQKRRDYLWTIINALVNKNIYRSIHKPPI
ncbi:MAG: hypothetical protein JXR60_01065 [Bacteroidales bacterium]|nr:hypothetical protein [Bacteroidales bacterium]